MRDAGADGYVAARDAGADGYVAARQATAPGPGPWVGASVYTDFTGSGSTVFNYR